MCGLYHIAVHLLVVMTGLDRQGRKRKANVGRSASVQLFRLLLGCGVKEVQRTNTSKLVFAGRGMAAVVLPLVAGVLLRWGNDGKIKLEIPVSEGELSRLHDVAIDRGWRLWKGVRGVRVGSLGVWGRLMMSCEGWIWRSGG